MGWRRRGEDEKEEGGRREGRKTGIGHMAHRVAIFDTTRGFFIQTVRSGVV